MNRLAGKSNKGVKKYRKYSEFKGQAEIKNKIQNINKNGEKKWFFYTKRLNRLVWKVRNIKNVVKECSEQINWTTQKKREKIK